MKRQQLRPDLRKTLQRVYKGESHDLPSVQYRGQEYDGIIHQWVLDLEFAADAFQRARRIRNKLSDDMWDINNNDYVALCKWVETGLDRLQQFDVESQGTLSRVLVLPWLDLRIDRNDLVHAFQENEPERV